VVRFIRLGWARPLGGRQLFEGSLRPHLDVADLAARHRLGRRRATVILKSKEELLLMVLD